MTNRANLRQIFVILLFAAGVFSPGLFAAPDEEFAKEIRPLMQKKCFDCHGPEKKKGDLDLTTFTNYQAVLQFPQTWQTVYERVQAFEMPPKKAGDLSYDQQRKFMQWLRALPRPEIDCEKLASDRTQNFYKGYVMSRRLNRAEYNNTVGDLLGLDLELEELLPADGGGGEGFDTAGNALFTSTIHLEKYLHAAEQALASALPDKSRGLAPPIARARARLLGVVPSRRVKPRDAARINIAGFMRRAFRRPVAEEEVERFLAMFDRGFDRGDGFIPSLRLALKAVLVSPHFLFLVEPEPNEGGTQPLSALPLASKLSYFVWSSMPDDELLGLAETGQLLQPEIYRAQLRRMLADPKAEALGERFALQWLDLERLEVRPDAEAFPEFDAELGQDMRREVTAYFNYIIRENRSLLELIDSNYTFLNQRLARHYGFAHVKGSHWQRFTLPDANRGGVVGMAAVHVATSYPLRTSPVLRGRWVLEALLGERVPPPPPETPALDEESPSAAQLTFRQQLELHRANPECASCHDRMDPLGFGLENFDVLGRWRAQDRGQPIDATGALPSGQSFTGPAGLKKVLMARQDDILKHLIRKMAGYAFGRELNKFDQCVIDKTMEALRANDHRAWILIEQIATSLPFQYRFYPKQDS